VPAPLWHGEGMTTATISVHGLSKRFGDRVAVDGLTLDVPRGVVAGFVGPNGAGKTTTMAMLLGLVAPTAALARCSAAPWTTQPVTWGAWARWSRARLCGPG
jgi:ABC-type multidrug transport system ATPase subunit